MRREQRVSGGNVPIPFFELVGLTLRTEPRGGSGAEADAARRLPPLRLMSCGRRAAVTLGGLLSRLGRRACGSPPRRLLCGVSRHLIKTPVFQAIEPSPGRSSVA
jgi:hypothetical protein